MLWLSMLNSPLISEWFDRKGVTTLVQRYRGIGILAANDSRGLIPVMRGAP